MMPWKRSWPELNENLPVDVMPNSNGEFIPKLPTKEQRAIMQLAREESDRLARKMGMSRRHFLRTSMGMAVGFWAINQVRGGRFGRYALALGDPACENATGTDGKPYQLNNLPGEWIFDIQTHHIDSAGQWRITNPAMEAFFAAIWSQASPIPGLSRHKYDKNRELDPIEYLSQYYYLKEIFLDSATSASVLSAVPSSQELNPLPTLVAAETVRRVNDPIDGLAKSPRMVMHAFVMPNYGSAGTTAYPDGPDPVFMKQEFHHMDDAANALGPGGTVLDNALRAWKVYTPWGDIPYASGWFLDDRVGRQFCEKVIEVGSRTGMPKTICCHKGFALPTFDQRAASPKDIGPVAKDYHSEGLNIIVYHSGYTGGTSQLSTQSEDGDGAYPGDDKWDSSKLGTNSLVKSLRENGWSARHWAPGGQPGVAGAAGDGDPNQHGNAPNVYAEIGSAWAAVFNDPEAAGHMLLKLIYYVGPKRVVWGTDSLWFGSPQTVIAALRSYQPSQAMKDMYKLPHGLEGDVENPLNPAPTPSRTIRNAIFGRNAAVVYQMDPEAHLNAIACDEVQKIRDGYLINPLTPNPTQAAPMRSNAIPGYRTRRELFKDLASKPWGP
jgi:hypothetical protein